MSKGRVLIVEDDAEVARALAERLEDAGHEVEVVTTAARGVQRAVADPPETIVLELRLPRGGGPLAFHYLRRSFRTSHIAVVVHDRQRGHIEDGAPMEELIAAQPRI